VYTAVGDLDGTDPFFDCKRRQNNSLFTVQEEKVENDGEI